MKKNFYPLMILALLGIFTLTACGPSGPSEVQVSLTEWGITLDSAEVKAGEIIFTITNDGALEHNFAVEGTDSIIELIPATLQDTMTITLEPGDYQLICTLAGHLEAGMTTEFTVTP